MIVYDMDSEYIGVEITKYTDPLNLYKIFIDYVNKYNKLPIYIDICFRDKYSGYITKKISNNVFTSKNYLYKTDKIIDKMGYRQTNYGWFCEILQHAFQDFLKYERGEL